MLITGRNNLTTRKKVLRGQGAADQARISRDRSSRHQAVSPRGLPAVVDRVRTCSTSTNLLNADSSFCSCLCRRSAATFRAPVAHDDDAIVGQHNCEMLRWRCIAVVLATMRLRISCTSMWGVSGFGSSARDYGYG